VTFQSSKDANRAIEDYNKTEIEGKIVTIELSKRTKPHNPTPGVYLGPSSATTKSRRGSSPEYYRRRKYRSRSRSRSYRNSRYKRDYSRSRS